MWFEFSTADVLFIGPRLLAGMASGSVMFLDDEVASFNTHYLQVLESLWLMYCSLELGRHVIWHMNDHFVLL